MPSQAPLRFFEEEKTQETSLEELLASDKSTFPRRISASQLAQYFERHCQRYCSRLRYHSLLLPLPMPAPAASNTAIVCILALSHVW
jgi:hypothetical protein